MLRTVTDLGGHDRTLELLRSTLSAERRCWLVGGAVRDRLRGVAVSDFDLVVGDDVAAAAKKLARGAGGGAFPLSDEFGAWRVVARSGGWRADLGPLHGSGIEDDLAQRDFTINALAEPLAGGGLIDPLGGLRDLEEGRLRLASADALEADPLRAMRLVRFVCELDVAVDPAATAAARRVARRLDEVAAERIYGELKRIIASDRAVTGVALLGELGLTAVVLPELEALRGVSQSRYHHLDVADHTQEVLVELIGLQNDPGSVFGPHSARSIESLLTEPLADELSRGVAMRFAALLHDVAKPETRTVADDGRIAFPGHDAAGSELARTMLGRLRASARVQAYVADLTLHHLRLGFLVARRPLSRVDLYRYLDACGPVAADVTVLSVADRRATRGDRASESIEAHLELARGVIDEALRWHFDGHPQPPMRGDELASALGIEPGPRLGELLALVTEAQFTGEVRTSAEAVAYARERIDRVG